MNAPHRKDGEKLWDYIARSMTDREFKKAVPCHDKRLRLVMKEASTK